MAVEQEFGKPKTNGSRVSSIYSERIASWRATCALRCTSLASCKRAWRVTVLPCHRAALSYDALPQPRCRPPPSTRTKADCLFRGMEPAYCLGAAGIMHIGDRRINSRPHKSAEVGIARTIDAHEWPTPLVQELIKIKVVFLSPTSCRRRASSKNRKSPSC